MTPQAAAALRCPVCGGALMPLGTSLRCPQGHSYDMAKEGYVNLLAIQRRHAADPGDGKAMVRARRAFLQAGYYAPFQKALAELCLEYAPECGETHLLDAGCGEGSYDRVVYDAFAAQGRPCVLAGFDLSKDAIRLAAKAGADRVELYTEPYATMYPDDAEAAIAPFVQSAVTAHKAGLGVNAGHDLSLENLKFFHERMPYLDEVSIGHALISDALYLGLEETIKQYKNCLK